MMVLTTPLTPETFLSLPRRGVIAPNPNGTLGLYSVSTHEFGKGTKKEWRVMELSSGHSFQLTDDEKVQEANWLPGCDKTVIWLCSGDKGVTDVVITNVADATSPSESYRAAVVNAPIEALKLKELNQGAIAFAVVCLADHEGRMYNEDADENQKLSTARIYDDISVRQWDTYVKPQKYAIFYSTLTANQDGRYELSGAFQNAVKDSGLEAPDTMYEDRGSAASSFDLGAPGILFVAADPKPKPTKPQYQLASDVYFVPIASWTAPPAGKPARVLPQMKHALGYASNPRFSPDGSMVSYLKLSFANEADVRLFTGHVESGTAFDVWNMVVGSPWDLVPSAFEYAPHGQSVFIKADNCGRVSLFELELRHGARPRPITADGSVLGYHPFHDQKGDLKLLVSASSFVESSVYTIFDPVSDSEPVVVSAATGSGKKLGLSRQQVSEMWFEGAEGALIQAWMTTPSNFDEEKKWPLVLVIHGGPESAARDQWHWRWNAAVWAEQGYVVVQPNFTGSTGFGVAFTNGIYGQWGGRPYQDLVHCMEHLSHIPYIDMDRAVAAGGSYGGYMVNWILGQPFAKKFKAAVCHDSIFDLTNFHLYSDEVTGTNDWGGPGFPWLNQANLDRWNPARPDRLQNWKHGPPTLFIHSDRDYRCVVTDGLAAFKTLRCQGVPARFLNFPDENHFVLKPENALVWHRTVFEWIERWVGKGPTAPATTGGQRDVVAAGTAARTPIELWN